jgi:hypothetical protein
VKSAEEWLKELNNCPAELRLPLIKQRDVEQQISGMKKAAEICVENTDALALCGCKECKMAMKIHTDILSAIAELEKQKK